MELFIKIAQFVSSLSLLIILHELGHFIPAKLFKTRVEKFYLFFDAYFSLFKKKIGGTEFGIGWLPLGGYVKISGMVDESMDTDYQKEEPKPWEFRSKPAWQRLIIMLGGVIVNIIVAAIIYAGIYTYWGEKYLPTENITHGLTFSEKAQSLGFVNGEVITHVDGEKIARYNDILPALLLGKDEVTSLNPITGESHSIKLSDQIAKEIIEQQTGFMTLNVPYQVSKFAENSVAQTAGIQEGDIMYSVNGTKTLGIADFRQLTKDHANQQITVEVLRGADTLSYQMTLGEDSKLGVYGTSDIQQFYEVKTTDYNVFQAMGAGFSKMGKRVSDYVSELGLMFRPETGAYKKVGGFIAIGKHFAPTWDWRRFWEFTAFLSVMLAVLNILPIPALDGGHVTFLIIEIITGRKVPDNVLGIAQTIGFVLLMMLFLYANVNDVIKLF